MLKLPKYHSCSSEGGWQHGHSISVASPRNRALLTARYQKQLQLMSVWSTKKGAANLDGRFGKHPQIPYPDAANHSVMNLIEMTAATAQSNLRSTAPVAMLKASYLFQSQHRTCNLLNKLRLQFKRRRGIHQEIYLARVCKHLCSALLRPGVPCTQHAVAAHTAAPQ
jgi:hypothetical protein